FLKEPVHGV
nr:Chain C, PROTEIN (HIV-RT VARIANT PEPTIDE I1F (FLKEPVHGV)) [synthetic construct]1I1F_F Chain F, PROTEIN (HIV-RT VARIANT PEPTIDE I1F (FLKEPVHGV)) [synthetic construct]